MEDAHHDVVELLVHFLKAPGVPHGILAHLQAAGGYATGVGRLSGTKEDPRLLELLHRFGGAGHIGPLRHRHNAAGDELFRSLSIQLVLGGAGQGDIAFNAPDTLAALGVGGGGDLVQIFLDAAPADLFDFPHNGQVDALFVKDIPVRIGHRHHLGPQLGGLLAGVDGHVAGTGDNHGFPRKAVPLHLPQHLLGEVA